MRSRRILELVKIVESHQVEEIEVSRFGSKIRISKSRQNTNPGAPSELHDYVVRSVPATPPVAEETAPSEDQLPPNAVEIRSPIVGTFYRAPAPDADPYVKIGDQITLQQPLCIIEAMKIMNIIESEHSGKLLKILVENAQPVEYNQPLFVIEKS
jgi:acetyl-CoA carboxylase biotin carboxyl carrier protein